MIVIEGLHIKGMAGNRRLSKSVSDTGLHELRRQLEYKARWHGRQIEVIDRWTPTSKTCSGCGFKRDELDLSVGEWTCPKCGESHDRDINAAMNVLHTAGRVGIDARAGWTETQSSMAKLQEVH